MASNLKAWRCAHIPILCVGNHDEKRKKTPTTKPRLEPMREPVLSSLIKPTGKTTKRLKVDLRQAQLVDDAGPTKFCLPTVDVEKQRTDQLRALPRTKTKRQHGDRPPQAFAVYKNLRLHGGADSALFLIRFIMEAMDKVLLREACATGTRMVEMRGQAFDLKTLLTAEPQAVRTGPTVQFGKPGDRFVLTDPALVSWPSGLYVRAEFADSVRDTCDVLDKFIQSTQPIPDLLALAKKADVGLLTRFGWSLSGNSSVRLGEKAAEEMLGIITGADFDHLTTTTRGIIERATKANTAQSRGVFLTPGIHGLPDAYINAARNELTATLDMPGAQLETLDRAYILPTRETARIIDADPHSPHNLQRQLRSYLSQLAAVRARRLLEGMDLEALKDVTNERLRFKGLDEHGIRTVADILDRPEATLMHIPGIGEQTARRMKAAAQTLLTEAQAQPDRNLGQEKLPATQAATEVLQTFEKTNTLSEEQAARRDRLLEYFTGFPPTLATIGQPFVLVKEGSAMFDQFIEDISWAQASPQSFLPGPMPTSTPDAWQDYLSRPAHYQTLLNVLLDSGNEVGTTLEGLSEHTIEAIRSLHLDDSHLKDLYLRGYQSFGAKFAVVQQKVILGDEMGLGKTVQAIAVAAHTAANYDPEAFAEHLEQLRKQQAGNTNQSKQETSRLEDPAKPRQAAGTEANQPNREVPDSHDNEAHHHDNADELQRLAVVPKRARILVVVPASLIVNWRRELTTLSDLEIFIGHGDIRQASIDAWTSSGGVLIMTYEGIRQQPLAPVNLVVIDEAHMIKNPAALRSQAAMKIIQESKGAILMSGTPMENRVSEFANLINYLHPGFVDPANPGTAASFRTTVAPYYLRRNQVDVLDELPEKVETIEWVEPSAQDQQLYQEAVASGNWMQLRQALNLAPGTGSAKVERMRELVAEAIADGRNVLIFSYFRRVLDRLAQEFGPQCVGIISGDVPPVRRQQLVDALGTDGPVLLAQIGAGGVGLNIQKASVVIIAEVQVKPTIEDQAIARAHRMGQTQVVHVHRIVGDETVDERLLEILAHKRKAFDAFARESDAADVADAVDVSETALAREIIAAERARLGLADDTQPEGGGDVVLDEDPDARPSQAQQQTPAPLDQTAEHLTAHLTEKQD